jgi:hypothetical protein
MDGIVGAIQSGSSSSKSMGEGNTEKGEFFHPAICCSRSVVANGVRAGF